MAIYLAPTDFSDDAAAAVREAVRRAELNGAELLLLHVTHGADLGHQVARPTHFPNLQQAVQESAQSQLEAVRDELVAGRVPVRLILRDGAPHAEIASVAADEHADLIVIASHGRTALRRFLLGGTTERVVRSAPCSVLVFKPKP